MEYFLISNEIKKTYLILFCEKRDVKFIKDILHKKYSYDIKLDSQILFLHKYTELPKIKIDNALVLDENTYEKLNIFINYKEIFLYSLNKTTHNIIYPKNTYGFYDYQYYSSNNKVDLKLAFKYFKKYAEVYELFSSGVNMAITTKKSSLFKNIPEYKQLLYIHNGFDTANRFIPEGRYLNKNISIEQKSIFNDSINYRMNCNINDLELNISDKLIKDFLGKN